MPNKLLLLVLVVVMVLGSTTTSKAEGFKLQNNARQRICQARQNNINNRTRVIINLSNKMLDNLNLQTQRVQGYYSQKMVPVGKIVPNYGDLVSQVQIKKGLVLSAIAKAQKEAEMFDCSQVNPQKTLANFKNSIKEVKVALKNYRTSVHKFMVTVKTTATLSKDS